MYKDKTVLLVAAIYRGLVNVKRTGIHIAMSDNRINFQIDPNPLCSGTDFGGDDRFYDRWVIDPHITQIGDEYYICCPGQGTIGPCELLEKSTDFKTTEFLGCIALPPLTRRLFYVRWQIYRNKVSECLVMVKHQLTITIIRGDYKNAIICNTAIRS